MVSEEPCFCFNSQKVSSHQHQVIPPSMNPLSTRPNRWRPITVFNLLLGLLFSLSALGQETFQTEGLLRRFTFTSGTEDWNLSPSGATQGVYEGRGCLKFSDGGWAVWERTRNQIIPKNPDFLTQSIWVYASSDTISGYILQRRQQTEGGGCSGLPSWMNLTLRSGITEANIDAPCWGNLSGSFALPTNKWIHIVYSRQGQQVKLYLNGLMISQKIYGGFASNNGWNEFNGSDRDYTIGKGYAGMGPDFFEKGFKMLGGFILVDDIRIYNRALSDTEVKALYDYESTPQPLNPRTATATAQVVNGFVVGTTIKDGGYGYVENPTVTITGGGGTGAKATATQINGVVTSITINNSGSGYTSTPTITIAPPPFPPRKATSTADIVNGFVVGAKITDGGFGYDTAPTVLLIGGGGSGATATATVVNGMVTAITIINSGSGYTSAPSIQIASPPFAPSLAIEVSRVSVRLKVVLGGKYQLEASTDLKTWTSTGPAFVAQAEELAQEFDVNQVGRYFRINQVP